MISCYLISQDTAKYNKVKHLIFIFCQNNFTVVASKDISMTSLPFHANFIKNTQKFFFTITHGIFLVLTVLLTNVREPKFPHPKSAFPFANALIGDQYVWKHLKHCNSDSSGIHSSAYVLHAQSLNQEWPRPSNEPNCHKYYTEPILEFNRTVKLNKDWQNILKSFFCEASIHWLRVLQFHQVLHHFHFLTLLDGKLVYYTNPKVLDTPF